MAIVAISYAHKLSPSQNSIIAAWTITKGGLKIRLSSFPGTLTLPGSANDLWVIGKSTLDNADQRQFLPAAGGTRFRYCCALYDILQLRTLAELSIRSGPRNS